MKETSPFLTSSSRIREMRESGTWPAMIPEFVAEERAFRVATAREAVRPKLRCRTAPAENEDRTCSSRELRRMLVIPFIILAGSALLLGVVWELLEIKAVYDFTLRVFPP
jgi:hypothetical protein